LAIGILERFAPDSGPLAGDLVEEFRRGRSPLWFWWQVAAALWIAAFSRPDEIRPLRLLDHQPVDALERTRALTRRFRPVNLTASPIHGIGGLGLVAISMLVTFVIPSVWIVLVGSTAAGVGVGLLLIARRRRALSSN
jgi:hypothetical protein